MKKSYEQPQMYAELFVSNHYCAACKDPGYELNVPSMEVRCQTDGHMNIAKDVIFFDGNTSCENKYDENATDAGFVQGVWDTGKTFFGYGNTVEWFYEDGYGSNNTPDGVIDSKDEGWQDLGNKVFNELVTAFRGFFYQDGTRHLFYAKVDKTLSQYNLS